nr:PAS domain-containing protein [Rhodoferax sp.]
MTEARRYGLRSLRFKLVLASVVVEIIMLTVLVWNSTRITGDAMREIFQNRVDTLVLLMNVSLANPLAQRDYATLDERLKRIVRQDSLTYIEVRDELGAVAASRGEVPKTARLDVSFKATDQVYDQAFDITLAGRVIGRAHYGLNVSLLQATLANLRNQGALVASAGIILTILLLSTLGALLTRHLRAVAQAARALAGGDYAVRIPVVGQDEVAETAQAFNTMADTLARDLADQKRAEEALRTSEERLELALESVHDGLWDWRVQSNAMYFSPRWKAMLGYTTDELADSFATWEQLLHPEDKPQVLATLRAHFDDPTRDYEPEFRMRHKNGRWIWIQSRGRVVERDAAGRPLRMLGTHIDSTERRHAQEALQQSEQRLRDLMDGLGSQMFVGLMTPDGVLVEVNQPALAAAGLKPEDVLGKPLEETYYWNYSEEIKQQLHAAIERAAHGEASRYDVQIRVAENQFIVIDFSIQPLRDKDGGIVFLIPSAMVITERKQAEEEIRVQLDELIRWQKVTLDREGRVQQLKAEVNELLRQRGEAVRYPSQADI